MDRKQKIEYLRRLAPGDLLRLLPARPEEWISTREEKELFTDRKIANWPAIRES